MSNTTYALAALPHRSLPDTKVINLRTTTNRKSKYKSLKITIAAKNWDIKSQRVKGGQRGEANADIINEKIQALLLKAQTEKHSNVGKKENSFVSYAYEVIQSTHTNNTKTNRTTALKKLEEYMKHRKMDDLPFNKLNNIFVEGYYSWLINEAGMKVSTANEYMQVLGQVIKKTTQSGKYTFTKDPFVNYKRKRTNHLIEVLDDEDLRKLQNYTPKTAKQREALHIFWFMMHMSGLRVSDAFTLTFNHFYLDNKGRLMVRYKSTKSASVVTTRISVEAALEITTFLGGYGQDQSIAQVQEIMKEYLEVSEKLKKDSEERETIQPFSLSYLLRSYKEEPDIKYHLDLLEREAKKEDRKEYLRFQVLFAEDKQEKLKQKILGIVGKALMNIKKSHPSDTVVPHMRGIYKGEERMSAEVEKICNNFKVKNNHHLYKIAKKLGIQKRISNHQARHVFAMRLFLKGVNIHYISLALGHSNIATTDKYRAKLVDDGVYDVTDEFSETFRAIG